MQSALLQKLQECVCDNYFRKRKIETYVYAVIAMCLEMKALGMTDAEIIEAVNQRNFFDTRLAETNNLSMGEY